MDAGLVKEICLRSTPWPITLLQEQHPESSHGMREQRELRVLKLTGHQSVPSSVSGTRVHRNLGAEQQKYRDFSAAAARHRRAPGGLEHLSAVAKGVPRSVKTLVAYAALIMWLPLLVPLLVWALMGDLILSLHGEEATKKLAEGLLPAALISGGVWGDAEKLLQNSPWPLRCSFSLHLVAFVIFLRSLCGAGRRQRWRDEAKDVSRYRNALCYARLKGSRVEPEAPLRAAEPQAAQASLPAQVAQRPGGAAGLRCVSQLRSWLESQGARLGSLRIAAAQDGPTAAEERGVYATEKIKVDEVIAEVPQSCVLSAERARESPVGKAFLKIFPEDKARDKWVFLLDLLAARVDATHPAHVYLAALPRESPTPMSWPANLRAMLAGTNLGAAVDEEREQLESQFAAMMPKLQAAHPELFSEDFTLENFLWAHGMWFSRRYPTAMASFDKDKDYSWQRRAEEDLEEESDGEGALVPFMDFTNHRSGTKIVWRASAEKITFVSSEGVEGGAEVFNNYGDKSNEDLMLIHGFALLDNIHDTYGLWLTVQVSDQPPGGPGGRKRRRALRTERIGPFHLRRKDAKWKQFPEDLWQALVPANAGNEHLKALSGLLRQLLQEFQETQTRDRHFAAGGDAEGVGDKLDPRIRYIARYRDGQRQVLEEGCKALEEPPLRCWLRAEQGGHQWMLISQTGYLYGSKLSTQ
ncbi:unnamed protein product [Cladocopium goreaui]|uniref:Ribosomal lysine N-methyltransferase set10 (SE T domain-containing protein 10) n=1 Tax=Cladocopium goreaui TaxID=2562237 RepID=A0A9P1GGZ8_9DINO|nr:unnamed protein product [Cladocopium goreaui]